MFQRNSRFCLTGVTGEWLCNLGNNYYEGHPDCTEGTSWEYIVRPQYERCDDNNLDQDDEGIYADPNDTGGTGGNNSNSDGSSTSTVPLTPCQQEVSTGQTVGITNGNGDCYEDDQIFDNITHEKIKCLHNNLRENGDDFVKNLLGNFEGDSEFDINISSKEKVFSNRLNTYVNGQTRYTVGEQLIYIILSEDKLSDRSVLAGIRTILHEYIHADMYRKLHTKDDVNSSVVKDFKETYNKYKNERQHNTMAELYVNSMASTLKQIHKTILLREYNYLSDNGNNSLDNLYEALAWKGLKEHNVEAYNNLPMSRKTELDNVLETYYHSLTKNCPQ